MIPDFGEEFWQPVDDEPGRKWDVIAFNGGHWNSGGSRKEYWTAFEKALTGSLRAGKKVIWITTGPVPFGYNVKPPSRTDSGTAILPEAQWPSIRFAHANVEEENCGRNAGRMMTQNRWVEDILKKHPEVAVCDHWGFVYSQEKVGGSPFRPWWYGKNVHFGEEAKSLPSNTKGRNGSIKAPCRWSRRRSRLRGNLEIQLG
jgi:hypothetical protein